MRILYLYFMLGYGVIFFKTKGFFSSLLHTQIEQFEVAISTIMAQWAYSSQAVASTNVATKNRTFFSFLFLERGKFKK